MQEHPTIHELINAARAGEKTSWNTLYHHYYPGLYAIAIQICKNIPLAQDMVQDAFVTAYLKLGQLKDTAAFSGWIKKILIHTCYRASASNQSWNEIPIETDSWWEDELSKKLDQISTQNNLYTTISNLPEVLRSTLLLRYFSAFQSYEEIAFILSIPVGTVRSRLNQAKLKLAELWKQAADADSKILKHSESWNSFYYNTLSGIHHYDNHKNQFVWHLHRHVQITAPGGNTVHGSIVFEKMIHDDREVGSWIAPVNIMSSGNISIIEAKHFNSSENPHHCPADSVMIIHRNKEKASKMQIRAFR